MTNSIHKTSKIKKKTVKKVASKPIKITATSSKAKATRKAKHAQLTLATRKRMIEETAYYHAQQRNFAPGNAIDDWLLAENEVDKIISNR